MNILVPKYRRNPNEKIESLYYGVAPGNQTVTSIVRRSADGNRMEAVRTYGAGLPRGVGGQIGVLVLGGMETTLDEMEYILEARRQKKFQPRRSVGDIMAMCRLVAERRNELIEAGRKHLKGNPSDTPHRPKRVLYLPVGFRMVATNVPGLKVLARSA